MPETSNDNVSRGELVKLVEDDTNNNYAEWSMKSHHQLRSWGLWKYIEGPGSEPPIIPPLQKTTECTGRTRQGVQETLVFPGNEEEHNKKTEEARPWMDGNDIALSKIVCAVPNSQLNLGDLQYAKEAWEALRAYYLPRNSHRVTSLKGDITAYRCGPGADIVQWLKAMGDMYNTLCCMDRHRMSDREFALVIIDNMPQAGRWHEFNSGLRNKVSEYDEHKPNPIPVRSAEFIVKIRDECWLRSRDNPQATTPYAFAARDDARKRGQQRASTSDRPPSKRARTDTLCTNQLCKFPKNHSFDQCIAYGGGNQGGYGPRWRGPWNIHLPPEQRSPANNVPPPTHPASTRGAPAGRPFAHYAYHAAPPPIYPENAPAMPMVPTYPYHPTPIPVPSYYSTPVPLDNVTTTPVAQPIPQYAYHPNAQTRSDTAYVPTTTDDRASIHSAVSNEGPYFAWHARLDDKIMVATLPVLEDTMPRTDTCHHDSGANRHVFHDKSVFETYYPIEPVSVSGFGRNLSAAAVGRGTVRVEGRYGERICQITLHNVLHIPAARSNLISGPQLDKAGIASILANGLATLSTRGQAIVGGALQNDMYRLNLKIIRPAPAHPLITRLGPPTLASTITPIVAAASSDQSGFYIA